MVLLNSWITWLEETRLTHQFVNAFLDRTWWVMLNLWDVQNVQKVDYQWG